MKAFVLGAGLGKRLRPLTSSWPKPLVSVYQKRLITFAFDHLIATGIEEIAVNTHHAAERYQEIFPNQSYRGRRLHFSHEPILLETGGGIKNLERFLGDHPFVVYNGDILTDFDLRGLIDWHKATGACATLGLRSKGGPLRVSLLGSQVVDIGRIRNPDSAMTHLFSGVYVLSSEVFDFLEPQKVESIIPALIRMMDAGLPIEGYVDETCEWFDLGERTALLTAHTALQEREAFPRWGLDEPWRQLIHPDAQIAESADLVGLTLVCRGAKIGDRTRLTNTLVFPGGEVAADSTLDSCIIGEGAKVAAGTCAKGCDFGGL